MENNDMGHTWKNSTKSSLDGGEAELMRAIDTLAKRIWRRNLLTVGAFILVILAMVYFITQMRFREPLTFVGIGLAGLSMLFILILKWHRQQGLSRYDMTEATADFLRIVHRRLRFSGWLIAYGVLIYIGLFAVGFVMILPEMLAGQDSITQFLVSSIGIAYLVFITVRGRARAKREYNHDVRPIIVRIESLLGQFE
jgi:hypothetical protein